MSTQPDNTPKNQQEIDRRLAQFEALQPFMKKCLRLNHDLNNPLAGIMGYAEFMLMEPDQLSDNQKGQLEQIIKACDKMKLMIQELTEAKVTLGDFQELD